MRNSIKKLLVLFASVLFIGTPTYYSANKADAASILNTNKTSEVVLGDANNDGYLDMADAVFIMQCLTGRYTPDNWEICDYNQNGIVSQMDVLAIQYALLGL